jgi:hypothetical protein
LALVGRPLVFGATLGRSLLFEGAGTGGKRASEPPETGPAALTETLSPH